jgi:hypothetical protein
MRSQHGTYRRSITRPNPEHIDIRKFRLCARQYRPPASFPSADGRPAKR